MAYKLRWNIMFEIFSSWTWDFAFRAFAKKQQNTISFRVHSCFKHSTES